MKQIILLLLATFVLSATFSEDPESRMGPAHNIENRGENVPSCADLYVRSGDSWLDETRQDPLPGGVSDCVDLHLWDPSKKKYYDRCCYVRFLLDGTMHSGCVGLVQEYVNDSTETIHRMETGDPAIWTRAAANSKIYQLDCNSNYLKYFSFAAILLLNLFF